MGNSSNCNSLNKSNFIDTLSIERLTETHSVLDFDCSTGYPDDVDMNDFIKNDALNEEYEGWNNTYVVVKKGESKVLGFFAISNDSFEIKPQLKKDLGKPYQKIPAQKIGRIAVDKNHQKKGIGCFMMEYAIGFITDKIAKNTGCRYITLDAYPHRVEWYKQHFQFTENTIIKHNSTKTVNLILDLKSFAEDLKK